MFTKIFTISTVCIFLSITNLLGADCEPYQIAIPDNNPALVFPKDSTCIYAARFLRTYIQKSTGEALAIVPESQVSPGKRVIYVGMTNFARQHVKFESLKPEELVVKPAGKHLIICGEVHKGYDRGTLFGVYEYLERQFGIRWYYPKLKLQPDFGAGTVIPQNQTITFPLQEIRSYPHFRMREGGVSYHYLLQAEIDWHPVLRFGNSLPHGKANHTQVNWKKLYYDTHPEYFALRFDGTRDTIFHCLSSEGLLNQLINNIYSYDATGEPQSAWSNGLPPTDNCIFFGNNDSFRWVARCRCLECKPKYGKNNTNPTGCASNYVTDFVIKYANEVKTRWPHRRFATIAHGMYSDPPLSRVIPEHVDITYVKPEINLGYDTAFVNVYLKRTKQWHSLLDKNKERLTLWLNVSELLGTNNKTKFSYCPVMYPNILQRWLVATKDLTAGYYINGYNPYFRPKAKVFNVGTIQTFPMIYIQSRLLWNPDADVKEMLKEFCDNLYGPASPEMLAFYNRLIDRWENVDDLSNNNPDSINFNLVQFVHQGKFPPEQIDALRQQLNNAVSAANGDNPSKDRIIYLRDKIYQKFFHESDSIHNRLLPNP